MLDRYRITINQITTNALTLPQAAEAYAAAGIKGITPWRDKVEAVGVAAARQVIADNGLSVTGFCLAGLFSRDGKGARAGRIDDARRAIDIAAELGSPSIVTVVGGLLPGSKSLAEARSFAFDCLAETLEHARKAGVVMALEPLHPMYAPDWSVISRLSDANAWCDRLGDGIGVAVDAYHVWWDSDLWQGIEEAGKRNRLAAFHISDWKMQTESLLMDRGIPGEGVIDLKAIGEAMSKAGFGGWVEVEIFSERHWARPADQLIEDIVAGCLNTM
ncbi:sugar phosphate isomerase/epimerase family protein [Mesorhizobium sp. IMUNJ 23232]|uniref:sugar phosphate isomerase/epimerase family protein n=1 Tax=Mesorhizobium sp. IMUNJ 23232 TaxID=3376064 RepID=UPI003799D6AC